MGTYKIIVENEIMTAQHALNTALKRSDDLDACLNWLEKAIGYLLTAREEICREQGREEMRLESGV